MHPPPRSRVAGKEGGRRRTCYQVGEKKSLSPRSNRSASAVVGKDRDGGEKIIRKKQQRPEGPLCVSVRKGIRGVGVGVTTQPAIERLVFGLVEGGGEEPFSFAALLWQRFFFSPGAGKGGRGRGEKVVEVEVTSVLLLRRWGTDADRPNE